MTPLEMYDEFRSYLDTDTDGFFAGAEVWRKLHNAQQFLIRRIAQSSPSYYIVSTSITLVAGQATYTLPLNARLGSKIVFTEDVDDYLEVLPDEMVTKLDMDAPGIVNYTDEWFFTLERDKFRAMPTPLSADTLKAWYVPNFGNMLQGAVAAAGTTSLTFPSTDPDYTENYGVVDKRDDFYNNMILQILDGNGEGEYREITDYTGGGTLQATVAAWSTTPDTDSTYAVMCPVPEDFHELVPLRAAVHGAVKNRNRLTELRSLLRDGLNDLHNWVTARQYARGQVVVPYDRDPL